MVSDGFNLMGSSFHILGVITEKVAMYVSDCSIISCGTTPYISHTTEPEDHDLISK